MALGAIAAVMGAGRAGYGIYRAQRAKFRRLNRIQEAYTAASSQLRKQQGDIRQGHEESLIARGISGGGEKSMGAQQRTDLEGEFQFERDDLDRRRRWVVEDVKSAASDEILGAIEQGVSTGANVYSAGKGMQGMSSIQAAMTQGQPTVNPAASSATWSSGTQLSPIAAAMTGIDDPSNSWGGIHALDPLHAPGSSWNRQGQVVGRGQPNDAFNVVG